MKQVISVRILGPQRSRRFGGFACYAYVIRNKQGQLLHEAFGLAEKQDAQSPVSSSIVPAYIALIKALEWLTGHGYQNDIIIVKTASKSLISQLDDVYQSPHQIDNKNISKNVIQLFAKAKKLKSRFYKVSYELVSKSVKGNNNNAVNAADDDSNYSIEQSKEIEELLVLAYVEAEEKLLKQNYTAPDQKSPFVTAAQLMKKKKNTKTQAS